MTQQTLSYEPAERLSLCDKLEAYLKARPNKWIDGRMFEDIAGRYAWRTRLSDLRKRGMVIENRRRTIYTHESRCYALQAWDIPGACVCGTSRKVTVSEYRYVPEGAREGSSSY
jgi:hypothetical protein